jgi:predicted AlkP superfamily pyrophosphatase or phosphodiesterase
VFKSSLESVLGEANPLGFQARKKVLVILIDGLGAEQILARSGHAPWLAAAVKAGGVSHGSFPSTTSANITSFATGLTPGEHGFIGHMIQDRHHNKRLNLLTGWSGFEKLEEWQPHKTISEMAFERGVVCNVIGPEEYRSTGFTQATMRKASYLAAEGLRERFERARQVLALPESSITYLYVPELDKFGHKNGWSSSGWAALLEDLDATIGNFIASVPKDVGVVITADHGMVDTTDEKKIFLDDALDHGGHLEFFGGDTRSGFVYLDSPRSIPVLLESLAKYSNFLQAVPTQDAIDANFFGPIGEEASQRLPEILLLAKSNFTLFHSVHSKKKSSEMISHHGALTSAETRIPLIRVGI